MVFFRIMFKITFSQINYIFFMKTILDYSLYVYFKFNYNTYDTVFVSGLQKKQGRQHP